MNNIEQFQFLMYRPLYWFGVGTSPNVNPSLSRWPRRRRSPANTVTINLKNYKWANGETVTAQDVLFFMNIYHAEKANFCGYVTGDFPDNVTNVTASGQHRDLHVQQGLQPALDPLQRALPDHADADRLGHHVRRCGAAGSGGCSSAAYGTADAACAKVYTFLANAAGFNPNNPSAANNSLSTYATNPLWQVVDGPWKLKAFNPDGQNTMVPNPTYSGPIKPTLKSFTELPYTADSAEFNALVGGNLSVGYVPTKRPVLRARRTRTSPGPNNPRLSGTYDLTPLYTFSINYFPENFSSNANGGVTGKLFSQLYIRQAMQDLVDQPLYIKKIFKGYAVPTYGPVPVVPPNPYASTLEKTNPYPYSPSQGQGAAGGQRVEGGAQRDRHLHQGRDGQG